MNNSEELYLTDLISVDILQKLQDAISEMTGMAALTTDKYGTPVTNGSNFSEFCTKYTRKSKLGEIRCMRCDKTGAELTMNSHKACSYYCHAGLIDYAAPIMANGEMIGSFIGGQVLPMPPNMDEVEKTAIELGIDPEKYKEAAAKIKVVDTETIDKSARFLRIVAECLSHLAYQSYELHKSNVEIENASHLKSDFLANMSHEIRTPMNAVLGMVDLALREEMSDTAKEYMHQIKTSAKNLLVIINDILDFSKIESGKMDVIDVSYEPLSIVNDLAAIAKSKIGNKDIEFTMNIKPDMPQSLFGDNVRIHQILLNLITNAVKFTQQGEVHLDFDCVRESDEKAVLKVSVTDTGIGIKTSDFNKLFNSFQQVDSKRNRNIEGTGLGLVICKQLLELMGGSITLRSEYGKGSTFSFEVPQKIVDKTPAIPQLDEKLTAGVMLDNIYAGRQLVRDLEWIGADPVVLNNIQHLEQIECDYIIVAKDYFTDSLRDFLTKHNDVKCIVVDEFGSANDIFFPNVKVINKPVYSLNLYNAMGISNFETRDEMNEFDCFTFISPESNILIVDDNSVNLKVAVGLIEPLEMNVDTAESAAKAIEMASRKKYDLIFMDHMMPEVDGVEATHIIRRMLPSYNETPIVALTANAIGGAKEMFIKEGMNDFVAKPIEVRDIVSKIRKWLPQEKILPVEKKSEEQEKVIPASDERIIYDIEGLNVTSAIEMLGTEKLFLSVLKEFYRTIDQKSQSIQSHLVNKEWKEYTIEVHALKSAVRQIGAEYLGDLAVELETAGKEGNISLIIEKNDHMIAEYTKYKDILEPLFNELESDNAYSDGDELYFLLGTMSEVLHTFDILEIDDIAEKIGRCSIPESQAEYFDKLKKAIEESDIDMCNEVVDEWKQVIAPDQPGDDGCITTEKIFDMLDNLQAALNDFDTLRIDEAVEELEKHTYPAKQQELLELIHKYAQESDIDNCSDVVAKWHGMLL